MSFNVFSENEKKINDYQAMLEDISKEDSHQKIKLDAVNTEKATLISAYLEELLRTKEGDIATFAINNLGEQFQGIVTSRAGKTKETLEADIDTLFNFLGQVAQEVFLRKEKFPKAAAANILNYYQHSPNRTEDEKSLALFFLGKLPLLVHADIINNSKDSVASKLADVDFKIEQWNKKLDNLSETESKVKELAEELERKKLSFSFLGLAAAFKEFHGRKTTSLYINLIFVSIFGLLLIGTPIYALYEISNNDYKYLISVKSLDNLQIELSNNKNIDTSEINKNILEIKESLASNEKQNNNFKNKWYLFLPFITVEILLLYFFRIFLQNFNSAKSQIMQLETRNSVCQFIEPYIKFKIENKDSEASLSSFESLVFSNLAPSDEKVPSTFDGLEQLGRLIKNIKS